jgi:hypothetical protein
MCRNKMKRNHVIGAGVRSTVAVLGLATNQGRRQPPRGRFCSCTCCGDVIEGLGWLCKCLSCKSSESIEDKYNIHGKSPNLSTTHPPSLLERTSWIA